MNKVQKISSYLLFILNLLLIVLPLFVIITWYFIDTYTINEFSSGLLQNSFQMQDAIDAKKIHWTLTSRIIGASGHIMNLLPLFLSIFILKSIFKNYKNGKIFTTANAVYYKYLGWLALFDALFANPIGNAIMIMSTTLANSSDQRHIDIIFGYPSIEGLFCGAIFIVISLVMLEASKLQDEAELLI